MATVKPFKALRPTPELVSRVASLPYDVMTSDEARELVKDNPYSYLHVDKSEVDLPRDTDLYDPIVYQTARDNLYRMVAEGTLIREEKACFYILKQVMDGRAQIGIVGCPSIDDYMDDKIKKHELTRAEKEEDRVNHVDICNANTGMVFLLYRARQAIDEVVNRVMGEKAPVYDFSFDGVQQTVWVVDQDADISTIVKEFADTEYLYIADGHHRCASAVRVGKKRRAQNPGYTGEEEFNYIMTTLFPDDQLYIMDYNRVVKDLNGLSQDEFMQKIDEKFHVEQCAGDAPYAPEKAHTFGMYLGSRWYKLEAREGTYDPKDPVGSLDVSILQKNLLDPVLGIKDPRTDKRIDFVGGIRGLKELERRANSDMTVAFSMYPTTVGELIDIANAGQIMPPKSTWFEPKLLSGLFVHELG